MSEKKLYAVVHHLTGEVLNIIECAEHDVEHILVGLHLKVPCTSDTKVGDVHVVQNSSHDVASTEGAQESGDPVQSGETVSPNGAGDEHAD